MLMSYIRNGKKGANICFWRPGEIGYGLIARTSYLDALWAVPGALEDWS